ncbi:MAG: phosphoenolpyruvate--protein phosphotransferase [Aquabacterium sp.]
MSIKGVALMQSSYRLIGQCASPGFAAGIVRRIDSAAAAAARPAVTVPGVDGLRTAMAFAVDELRLLAAAAEGEAVDMLDFQIAMLEDEALSEDACARIAGGEGVPEAWAKSMNAEIAGYEASGDAYFRARAIDICDIRDRVLDILNGVARGSVAPGTIMLADDLTPSRFLTTDWRGGAILLRHGSVSSHVAMLARSRGVPMIVGLQPANDLDSRYVIIDAKNGLVIADPNPQERSAFETARQAGATPRAEINADPLKPATTRSGQRVLTLINIADPAELDDLDPAICDGIGLVRTELMFGGHAPPDEDTQAAAYTRIVRWAAGRVVTFRTLDAGGDKPILGLTPEGESNPFLGLRGVRLTLQRTDIFRTQLRAMARAAALGPVEVMVPMVSVARELEACRSLLEEVCVELASAGLAHAAPPLGMMVEVPSAALTLDLFDAAFLSIGSNDLTQYVMAAARDIAAVSGLADPFPDAVLRLIGSVVRYGEEKRLKVSVCGDAGGDPEVIPLLLAQGVRILSMSPHQVAEAKRVIAGLILPASPSGADLAKGGRDG